MANITESLNEYIKIHIGAIHEFLNSKPAGKALPIFTSIDIRNSGFKIAPVDTNVFPAGFNNLNESGIELFAQHVKSYLQAHFPYVRNILIFPEDFTRNTKYMENLDTLLTIFKVAGFNAKVGTNLKDIDLVVLNNDLTAGIPEVIADTKIPVIPSVDLGWLSRRKHKHFEIYNALMDELCKLHNLDPWLLSTKFTDCEGVDFKNRVGLEDLAAKVEHTISKIKEKYLQHEINERPFVFVKANQGTYGMGLMVAYSGEDIISINKKKRHSMQSIKQGVQNTALIIQEGVPTIEEYNGDPCESLVYACNGDAIQTFIRSHGSKTPYVSLNSPGMNFSITDDELGPIKNLIAKVASTAVIFEC
ncbi:MAG: glutamate--cysteine ligase [Candidatus Midichloriaceae bacterium]|jgi:glutamate--cysteine ligase|nr:glutamate--cysteine ligase [Candidatus Midichloriaceae bacterium]